MITLFGNLLKIKKKSFVKSPTLTDNNKDYISDKEKTDIFAHTFEQVHILNPSNTTDQTNKIEKTANISN